MINLKKQSKKVLWLKNAVRTLRTKNQVFPSEKKTHQVTQ